MNSSLAKLKSNGLIWSIDERVSTSQSNPLTLSPGSVHEFFLETSLTKEKDHKFWLAPLSIIFALMKSEDLLLNIWIGNEVWPYKYRNSGKQNIFLDCRTTKERFWCAHKALNCANVICNAKGFSPIASRKLAFTAKRQNTTAFLLRPPWEAEKTSSATTRWKIYPEKNQTKTWKVTLIKAKGFFVPQSWLAIKNENNCIHFSSLDIKRANCSKDKRRA